MNNDSPAIILYDRFGMPMAVTGGIVIPVSTSALLMAGMTAAGTASFLQTDPDGTLRVTGIVSSVSSTITGTVDQGTPNLSQLNSWFVRISDGTKVLGTGSSAPLFVTGSVSLSQIATITGSITVPNLVSITGSVSASIVGIPTVTGSVSVLNRVGVSGSVDSIIRDEGTGVSAEVGANGSLRVGRDTLLFQEMFDLGINTNVWNDYSSSVSASFDSISSGSLIINVPASTPSGTFWQLETLKRFGFLSHCPMSFHSRMKFNSYGTGSNFSFGLLSGSIGASPPFAGYFFRVDSTGSLNFVVNANGTESITFIRSVPLGRWLDCHAQIGVEKIVAETIDAASTTNSTTTVIPKPNNLGSTGFSHLPFVFRVHDQAATTGSTNISVDNVGVFRNDIDTGYDWEHSLASMGRNAITDPATFLQATNYVINSAPSLGTLSSVTPAYVTLGGQFAVAAPTGSEQDYNLFAYQIPDRFQLNLRTITINVFDFGANVGGTPTVAQFALGINSVSASLLTNPLGPKTIPLGTCFADVNVKVGSVYSPTPIVYQPTVPITVDSNRFLHIILRVPVGIATNNQQIRGTVAIDGFFA